MNTKMKRVQSIILTPGPHDNAYSSPSLTFRSTDDDDIIELDMFEPARGFGQLESPSQRITMKMTRKEWADFVHTIER